MTISALTVLIVGLVVVAVLAALAWAYGTANRLDRLHVRTDLSWQALDAALARRAVVVRGIAATLVGESRDLSAAADRAERASRDDREAAENALSIALTALDAARLRPQLVAELADAEARVVIARRFYNDAVRDTLALRARRPVRWLHLGGTARDPRYFEITERGTPEETAPRLSARVVVLDGEDRVLLAHGHDPEDHDRTFWFTIGGGVEEGESVRDAAVREVLEETGLAVSADDLFGPLWRRIASFRFDGATMRSEEIFFAVRTDHFTPSGTPTERERRMDLGYRWFDRAALAELVAGDEPVIPRGLPDLLDEAREIVEGERAPRLHAIT